MPSAKYEKPAIFILCAIAALRIFVFSAAFPFFSNMDEQMHLDTVIKYARGHLPDVEDAPFDESSLDFISHYAALDYINKPEEFPGGVMPLPASLCSEDVASSRIVGARKMWQMILNHEALSPPLYYVIAGIWYNIGKLIAVKGLSLLYWVRFFNIIIVVLLVWLSYAIARFFYPEDISLRMGLPLLVAFFPQDVFYCINSDTLSPLLFGAAFYLLIKLYLSDFYNYRLCLLSGIFVAATFLTKLSNIAIVWMAILIAVLKIIKINTREKASGQSLRILFMLIVAGLPMIIWLGRNYFLLGDPLGVAVKINLLGWTRQPFGEIWRHPIFTPKGIAIFWNDLMPTFWRGEIVWHLRPIVSKKLDIFFSMSSLVFISAAAIASLFKKSAFSGGKRFIINMSFSVFLFSVIFLAGLSTFYDFGTCFAPSRHYPYFTSGRLMLGILIPFLILYVEGLSVVLGCIKQFLKPITAIMIIVASITCVEILLTWRIFGVAYNWFHMRGY